jgi:hypothetical protein
LAQNVGVQGRTQPEIAMPAPYHAEEKLWMALRRLTAADSQRKRLESAYMDHLSYLEDSEIPVPAQPKFTQLRDALTHEKQLNPEIAIAAMSDAEVADAVRLICDLRDAVSSAP